MKDPLVRQDLLGVEDCSTSAGPSAYGMTSARFFCAQPPAAWDGDQD